MSLRLFSGTEGAQTFLQELLDMDFLADGRGHAIHTTTTEEADACNSQRDSILSSIDYIQEMLRDLYQERDQLLAEQHKRASFLGPSLNEKSVVHSLASAERHLRLMFDELELPNKRPEAPRQQLEAQDVTTPDVRQEKGIKQTRGYMRGRAIHEMMPAFSISDLGIVHDFISDHAINNSRKGHERSMLPTLINGTPFDALPDTNASENFITAEQVAKLGASIDRSPNKQKIYRNACGGKFKAIGEAVLDICFPSTPSSVWRQHRFSVVEKLAATVIIGEPFLRLTETLTKFRHRLKKVSDPFKKLWRVCLLDSPRRQMSCFIDGVPVMVNADTGSDVDLVSLDYARSHGWDIHTMPNEDGFVVLADGTEKQISGYVNIPLRIASSVYSVTLHVLDGLVCDVLLGDLTLEEIDAFNRHEECFLEYDSEDEFGICHNISWCEVTDRRLISILEGEFPKKTAAELQEHRFNRVGFKFASSARDAQAWNEAFDRALSHLKNREVTARTKAQQDMAKFSDRQLERAKRLELERQERHRQRVSIIKQEREKFLGVVPSTV